MNTTLLDNAMDNYLKSVASLKKYPPFKEQWGSVYNHEVINHYYTVNNGDLLETTVKMTIQKYENAFDNFFKLHPEVIEPFYNHFRKHSPTKMFIDVMNWYKKHLKQINKTLSGSPTKITLYEKKDFLIYTLLVEVNVDDYKNRMYAYFM